MPKLSQEQQDQRRSRILDAAELCFAAAGFHPTTMQDIRKAAGISAGALYTYFDSKEALISGISERDRAEIIAKFSALSESADFSDGLRTVMRTCIVEQPPHKSQLYLAIASEATHNPSVAKALSECDGAIRASLEGFLQRAHAAGRIAPTAPIERVVAVMCVIADGMFWRRAVDPSIDLAAVATDLLDIIGSLVGMRDAALSPTVQAAQ